jgi:hypothetical protein
MTRTQNKHGVHSCGSLTPFLLMVVYGPLVAVFLIALFPPKQPAHGFFFFPRRCRKGLFPLAVPDSGFAWTRFSSCATIISLIVSLIVSLLLGARVPRLLLVEVLQPLGRGGGGLRLALGLVGDVGVLLLLLVETRLDDLGSSGESRALARLCLGLFGLALSP